ncbi:hypothetical protein ABVT39_004852, partial [Epinephelus coioides]
GNKAQSSGPSETRYRRFSCWCPPPHRSLASSSDSLRRGRTIGPDTWNETTTAAVVGTQH